LIFFEGAKIGKAANGNDVEILFNDAQIQMVTTTSLAPPLGLTEH
jgi:hypothetical protein